MNKKIGYLTFGRDDFSYGLAVCLSRLKGVDLYRVTPKTARYVDVLLFSCFWWEHIFLLADFLRKSGISKENKDRPWIVVGGFNTFNPVPFFAYADAVVCGDGEEAIHAAIAGDCHEGIYTGGHATWQNIESLSGFCHETNNIARVEISRGCKFKCRFCAVSHLKPYREVSLESVRAALLGTKLKRVSLFSPEPTMHSQDKEITDLCHRLGKVRQDSDVRLDRLALRSDSVPRVGIEGLSERLRKSVGKPYSNKRILEAVREAIDSGRKGMFMYMILDLPGESKEDWEEFRQLVSDIGAIPGASGFLLKPSPSVFMPSPHTPMEYEPINWQRDYHTMWSDFFGRGELRQWEVIMAERSRVFGSHMRLLSMLSTRSGEEFFSTESQLSAVGAISVSGGRLACKNKSKIEKTINKNGGIDKYCGVYTAKSAPWKALTISDQ